jgi:hypothetical protein
MHWNSNSTASPPRGRASRPPAAADLGFVAIQAYAELLLANCALR